MFSILFLKKKRYFSFIIVCIHLIQLGRAIMLEISQSEQLSEIKLILEMNVTRYGSSWIYEFTMRMCNNLCIYMRIDNITKISLRLNASVREHVYVWSFRSDGLKRYYLHKGVNNSYAEYRSSMIRYQHLYSMGFENMKVISKIVI